MAVVAEDDEKARPQPLTLAFVLLVGQGFDEVHIHGHRPGATCSFEAVAALGPPQEQQRSKLDNHAQNVIDLPKMHLAKRGGSVVITISWVGASTTSKLSDIPCSCKSIQVQRRREAPFVTCIVCAVGR